MKKSNMCLAVNLGGLACTLAFPSSKFIMISIQTVALIAQFYFLSKGE